MSATVLRIARSYPMRWASTSFAVQVRPGITAVESVGSSRLARTSSSSVRAPRISARKSVLLTPSLALRPGGGSMSGEGRLQLREVPIERPGRPDDPHHGAEERVVDLAPLEIGRASCRESVYRL